MESIFSKVRKIEITAKRQVLDVFSGMYVSAFKGRGIEMEDVREFQSGDDIRSISWTKTAQLGRPFVKEFREERDLTVMLVVDVSGSLAFGSHFETKRERLAEVGALLAFSAIYNHDRVGLLLFSNGVQREILPRRGMRHGARLIRELLGYEPQSMGTDIKSALDSFNRATKKRCICFLLSDFIATGFEKEFGYAAKKDDLVAVRLFDPLECEIPELGLCQMQDLETGRLMLVDVNSSVRAKVIDEAKQRRERFDKLVTKSGAGAVSIDTKSSFVSHLIAYFKMRKRQKR